MGIPPFQISLQRRRPTGKQNFWALLDKTPIPQTDAGLPHTLRTLKKTTNPFIATRRTRHPFGSQATGETAGPWLCVPALKKAGLPLSRMKRLQAKNAERFPDR